MMRWRLGLKKRLVSPLSKMLRAIGSIMDVEDCKVIAIGIIAILVIGLLLILLAGAAGLAVAVFEEVRGM